MRSTWIIFATVFYLSIGGTLNRLQAAVGGDKDAVVVAGEVDSRPSLSKGKALASDAFYDPEVVQTIRLEIDAGELKRMQESLPKRITVPAKFKWNGVEMPKVGVRYKGNSSSHPQAKHKRSFLITLDEYQRGQTLMGLKHVALDNGVQFGSIFSERLITDILRELGVKSSRCNYARLYINGEFLGVYVNVERIDKPFLSRNFGGNDGILLKVDEGGPGGDLQLMGDKAVYERTFEHHGGDKGKAYQELLRLIHHVNNPSGTEEELRRIFHWDSFITTTAVMLLAGAFDQYTGWNPHNYYLYQNTVDGRWVYIPWDLDVGFADKAFGRIPVLDGWNAAWPAPAPGRPLLEQLIAHPNLLEQYRAKAGSILETYFKPEVLVPKLRKLYAQVEQDLRKDPFPSRRVTVPSDTNYSDILDSMERFMTNRYQSAKAQLKQPGARPQPQPLAGPGKDEGPRPGAPSADAPRNLRAVKATASSVELRWEDRSEGEVAFVVQRANGSQGGEFVNAIGQGGRNIESATDSNVEPGMVYRYRVYAVHPTEQGPKGTGVSNEVVVRVPKK